DGALGGAGAGRHVRRVRAGGGIAAGRQSVPGRPGLAGARHPDGRLPGADAAGAVGGRAARALELVAFGSWLAGTGGQLRPEAFRNARAMTRYPAWLACWLGPRGV